jgi:hypothetical protein
MARTAFVATLLAVAGAVLLASGIVTVGVAVLAIGLVGLGMVPVGLLIPAMRHGSRRPVDRSFLGDVARAIETPPRAPERRDPPTGSPAGRERSRHPR